MEYKYLVVITLSVLPFIFSLNGDFVFDDSEAIVNNKDIISEDWSKLFYNDFWGTCIKSNLSHKSYRPLTVLSFRLNYITSGNKLIASHFKITNLVCHVACCILILFVYQIITKRLQVHKNNDDFYDVGYLGAMLFAVHPIHTEAICGIVGRADILSAITFFLSFIFYDKSTESNKYMYPYLFFSITLASVAMLFKENGITVLGFCIIYEIVTKFHNLGNKNTFLMKIRMVWKFNATSWKRIVIVLCSILILLHGRWLLMGGTKPEFKPSNNPAAFSSNIFTKVATFNYIYFLNFMLLIWPQWLCYDWSMGCVPLIENIQDYRLLAVILLYLYGFLYIIAIFKNKACSHRIMILAMSLLVIPYLPAANIFFPVGFVLAERILYLPSTGYCLIIAFIINKLCCHANKRIYKVTIIGYIFLISIYSMRSWQRSFDWQKEYNLFLNGFSVCPLNAKVRYNIAKVADAQQNTTLALFEYKEAIRLYPEYYQAMNNLANLLKNQKQFVEAEFHLRKALNLKEDFPAAWMNLGIVLANTKRYYESEMAYKTALKYRRVYPDCLYNLGNLIVKSISYQLCQQKQEADKNFFHKYLEMNNTEAAANSWFAALNLNPKHAHAWTNLIAMLDNTGQTRQALEIIPKALAELPNTPSLIFAVANIYGRINQFEVAEGYFIKAIQLFSQQNKVQAIHFANIGVLYHRWKKYDLAEQMYKRALEVDPTFKSAKKNLAQLHRLK